MNQNAAATSGKAFGFVSFLVLSLQVAAAQSAEIPELFPGVPAPPFTLQSLEGLLKFDGVNSSSGLQGPIVFHAFNNQSGFLEWLVDNPDSIKDLVRLSPNNTHYVFMFYDGALENAEALKNKFTKAVQKYCRMRSGQMRPTPFTGFGKPTIKPTAPGRRILNRCKDQWKEHLHFIKLPVSQSGNWIPRVLSQWYCSGHGCGLDQLVIENKTGLIAKVTKRLDARYDWLPSPTSLARFGHLEIVYVGDACSHFSANASGKLAMVSMEGNCSAFTKVFNSEKNGALGVVALSKPDGTLQDMNCVGDECNTLLNIPATMIPREPGLTAVLAGNPFARFQTTPSDSFFFAIDGQGKLQESGWFLFPSMRFMAYEAQWLNYKTEMLQNLTGSAKIINIFNETDISGHGVQARVEIPPLEELQRYQHVELDMSLSCLGNRDVTCPHWDHVVQVLVCCGQGPCRQQELGRWITAFRRRIGRWLTPVKPLIPLLSSAGAGSASTCTFTVRTVPWAKPWIVTLNIRLAGKIQAETILRHTIVPSKIESLFRGGEFNKDYNNKYQPVTFTPPTNYKRVELVAVITGHGSDNNNCAEFCITSHHFVVNGNHSNTRVFKNAGTALGCAERVREGVVPNEHGTWLYGRDGWCDGQDVVPWVRDITKQVVEGRPNNITYHGWFNGTDPNPTANPGNIIMYSYLVYYEQARTSIFS